jgi:hypothetical protein
MVMWVFGSCVGGEWDSFRHVLAHVRGTEGAKKGSLGSGHFV